MFIYCGEQIAHMTNDQISFIEESNRAKFAEVAVQIQGINDDCLRVLCRDQWGFKNFLMDIQGAGDGHAADQFPFIFLSTNHATKQLVSITGFC